MSAPAPGRYGFRDVVCGFFELPTESVRPILPAALQPIEPHHGQSVLAALAFDFDSGVCGAYQELVLAVLVAPRIAPGRPMPRSAMFPLIVATSTEDSRRHAIERYHLPHLMRDIEMEYARSDGRVEIAVSEGGRPAVEMTVTEHPDAGWDDVTHHYQSFMRDESGLYISDVALQGSLMEHEEERGGIVLHPHELTAPLRGADVNPVPFREQWMRGGQETMTLAMRLSAPAVAAR